MTPPLSIGSESIDVVSEESGVSEVAVVVDDSEIVLVAKDEVCVVVAEDDPDELALVTIEEGTLDGKELASKQPLINKDKARIDNV